MFKNQFPSFCLNFSNSFQSMNIGIFPPHRSTLISSHLWSSHRVNLITPFLCLLWAPILLSLLPALCAYGFALVILTELFICSQCRCRLSCKAQQRDPVCILLGFLLWQYLVKKENRVQLHKPDIEPCIAHQSYFDFPVQLIGHLCHLVWVCA